MYQNKNDDKSGMQEIELPNYDKAISLPPNGQYVVYFRRYIMATFFAISTITSSMMFATCNPIAAQLTIIYDTSPAIVSLASNGFFLMHPCFTFLQTYVVEKYSVGTSMRIGCLLTYLGAFIRILTSETNGFAIIIIGQIIAGMGRPFIINTQGNVARDWFKPEDKTTVMIAFSFLITCSQIVGVLVPAIVFKGYHAQNNPISIQQGKQLTDKLMNLELLIFSFMLIPTILFFQSKPPTPSGPVSTTENNYSYKESLQKTFSNHSFRLLFCCYTLIMGGFHALAVVISYLFTPFGFTTTQISVVQIAPIVCGFFSSIAYSILIRKYRPPLKKVITFSMMPVLIVLGLGYFILSTGSMFISLVSFAILGTFIIPQIPLLLETSCQVLYQVNQSMAVGFLLAGVHLWSFIFGEALAYATENQTKGEAFLGCILIFFSFLIAFLCLQLVKVPQKADSNSTEDIDQQSSSNGSVRMTDELSEGPI